MKNPNVASMEIQDFSLWEKIKARKIPFSFDLEITARCNNNCRHCYINLPAGDAEARAQEMTLDEIEDLADDAASMGALWCLITGGEPLLREDFPEIYLALKRRGLLLSVFTNATLINEDHIRLFLKYPPRDLEISVYGVSPETYERVTRRKGSFAAFQRGIELLVQNGIRFRLKAMVLRSNLHEISKISEYCQRITKDYYRFDPLLHLRFDGDPIRNQEIRDERLSPEEIVGVEMADPERFPAMQQECEELIVSEFKDIDSDLLFHCGAGRGSYCVSHDDKFRLCSALWHPDCVYDLRKGSLVEAWEVFVPRVHALRSTRKEFLQGCRCCPIINLCLWCPAHAHLECGEMDAFVDYFCDVASARANALTSLSGASDFKDAAQKKR